MGAKRFYSQNFSLFIAKFKKLGFSAPLKFSAPFKGVLNPNFLNLTVNREKVWLYKVTEIRNLDQNSF